MSRQIKNSDCNVFVVSYGYYGSIKLTEKSTTAMKTHNTYQSVLLQSLWYNGEEHQKFLSPALKRSLKNSLALMGLAKPATQTFKAYYRCSVRPPSTRIKGRKCKPFGHIFRDSAFPFQTRVREYFNQGTK